MVHPTLPEQKVPKASQTMFDLHRSLYHVSHACGGGITQEFDEDLDADEDEEEEWLARDSVLNRLESEQTEVYSRSTLDTKSADILQWRSEMHNANLGNKILT